MTEATTDRWTTKKELKRRLRIAFALVREAEGLGKSSPCEVGIRTKPVNSTTPPDGSWDWYAAGDDLDDFVQVKYLPTAKQEPELWQHGAVVHVYAQRMTYPPQHGWPAEYELDSTDCVWLGTPDHEPVLLDRNGRAVAPQGLYAPGERPTPERSAELRALAELGRAFYPEGSHAGEVRKAVVELDLPEAEAHAVEQAVAFRCELDEV